MQIIPDRLLILFKTAVNGVPQRSVHATSTSNLQDLEEDSHCDNDSGPLVKKRAPRNSKTGNNRAVKPTQMAYYSGAWLDVLEKAKFNYRLFLHTAADDPFPQRCQESLADALNCLVKAIAEHMDNPVAPALDQSMVIHSASIDDVLQNLQVHLTVKICLFWWVKLFCQIMFCSTDAGVKGV